MRLGLNSNIQNLEKYSKSWILFYLNLLSSNIAQNIISSFLELLPRCHDCLSSFTVIVTEKLKFQRELRFLTCWCQTPEVPLLACAKAFIVHGHMTFASAVPVQPVQNAQASPANYRVVLPVVLGNH